MMRTMKGYSVSVWGSCGGGGAEREVLGSSARFESEPTSNGDNIVHPANNKQFIQSLPGHA